MAHARNVLPRLHRQHILPMLPPSPNLGTLQTLPHRLVSPILPTIPPRPPAQMLHPPLPRNRNMAPLRDPRSPQLHRRHPNRRPRSIEPRSQRPTHRLTHSRCDIPVRIVTAHGHQHIQSRECESRRAVQLAGHDVHLRVPDRD